MTQLTKEGREALSDIAKRHDVSPGAVEHVLMALLAGQGTQAQFNHADLGGMGQWSRGGMTMVGDMFNNALKARVDALCTEVAQLMHRSELMHQPEHGATQSQNQGDGTSLFVAGRASGNWWPAELGHAASTGAQNQMRYAWFPDKSRLAIDSGDGDIRVYDTADHQIGGFSQQQSAGQSLSFTSQHGLVKLSELDQVGVGTKAESRLETAPVHGSQPLSEALLKAAAGSRELDAEPASPNAPAPAPANSTPGDSTPGDSSDAGTTPADKASDLAQSSADEADIFAKIERLAGLHQKGILTDQEYQSKKAELLARI